MDSFSFFVPGEPITEGSMRTFTSGQRVVVTHDRGPELAAWRTRVKLAAQEAAREAGWEPRYDGPVAVTAAFFLPRPKSAKKRLWLHVKPDLDKLIRAVGDALAPYKQPGVLKDDSRIVTWRASKDYADDYKPGVLIYVSRVDEEGLSATYDCAEWLEAEERKIQEDAE
jgi:Holliday junction resolvase RusA-like endonuclease